MLRWLLAKSAPRQRAKQACDSGTERPALTKTVRKGIGVLSPRTLHRCREDLRLLSNSGRGPQTSIAFDMSSICSSAAMFRGMSAKRPCTFSHSSRTSRASLWA